MYFDGTYLLIQVEGPRPQPIIQVCPTRAGPVRYMLHHSQSHRVCSWEPLVSTPFWSWAHLRDRGL